jgi:hypothetical protein
MTLVPDQYAARLARFPAELRALLEAELAAGNAIVDVASCHPAPPAGVYLKLLHPVSTRPRASGAGIGFYDRNSSLWSGEFHDERRFHFILEPPHPPPPEPDMDAIREAGNAEQPRPSPTDASAVGRFEQSMVIDYEKWHDGIGYDLEALRAATGDERTRIEDLLLTRGVYGWREVEALAALATPKAHAALVRAMAQGKHEVRMAVLQHAPQLLGEAERTKALVTALERAEFYGGLTQALDEVETFHPPAVIDALFRGVLTREGDVAVHFAAMLAFLHGQATEAFDWAQRPFFLRFHTIDRREREAAFRELCAKIGVQAEDHLTD